MTTTVAGESRKTKPFYQDMSVQVFAGMAAGALIGWLWPQTAEWMRTIGDLFIRLIAMFVGLIIFCAVVHGIATVREAKKVGRIAIKALIYFEVVTTFALVIGLAMINLLGPGRGMHVDLQSIVRMPALDQYLKTAQQISGSGFLLSIVPIRRSPPSPRAMSCRSCSFRSCSPSDCTRSARMASRCSQMIDLTKRDCLQDHRLHHVARPNRRHGRDRLHRRPVWNWLACLARRNGGRILSDLRSVHLPRPVADRLVERDQLWRFARYIRTELLIVVGTSSSESVFPQLVEKLLGLGCEDRSWASYCRPAMPSIMTALASISRPHPSFWRRPSVLISPWRSSLVCWASCLSLPKGGAGVAGSAIVVLVSTLAATGTVPVAAVGIILGVHRLMSSAFVAVNILGNALATIVIASWEGAVDRKVLNERLALGPE